MKICGIIAEYNPFHNGHALHLAESRRILGAETALVCVMSGNFVQRGELAILDKYVRAEAAVRGGADLVLELPLSATLSSADGFALGGVRALDALGAVGYLSFGSECGSARALDAAARALDEEKVQSALRCELQKGLSYAAASQAALAQTCPKTAALLSSPNNTLGISYCRAIRRTRSLLSPMSIRRRGISHDSSAPCGFLASASYLRERISCGDVDNCCDLMPHASFQLLGEAIALDSAPVVMPSLDQAMLAHLRRLTPEDFARYERPDEGLCNRLAQAVYQNGTYDAACIQAQTRRYPLARVRRAYLRAFLGLPLASAEEAPGYLRVLAIGARGRTLLRRFSDTAAVPLIIKPLHEKQLPDVLQPALLRDVLADDLYALAFPGARHRVGGSHFRNSPYCTSDGEG